MAWEKRRALLMKELGRVLVKTQALRFGTFTLTSGKTSSYYIDLRVVPSFPGVFKAVVNAFVEGIDNMVGPGRLDAIGGIPTAGLTFASAVAYRLEKPLIYVRKEEREHGVQKRVEGLLQPGWRVVILDDLITTGGSILRTAEAIREEGGVVKEAVVLIDRMEGGEEMLVKHDINLNSLAKITELADFLHQMDIIDDERKKAIYEMVGQRRP